MHNPSQQLLSSLMQKQLVGHCCHPLYVITQLQDRMGRHRMLKLVAYCHQNGLVMSLFVRLPWLI